MSTTGVVWRAFGSEEWVGGNEMNFIRFNSIQFNSSVSRAAWFDFLGSQMVGAAGIDICGGVNIIFVCVIDDAAKAFNENQDTFAIAIAIVDASAQTNILLLFIILAHYSKI
eukprot:jgi/Psemu1/303795/fgenesh1_kg.123_\